MISYRKMVAGLKVDDAFVVQMIDSVILPLALARRHAVPDAAGRSTGRPWRGRDFARRMGASQPTREEPTWIRRTNAASASATSAA